MKTTVATTPPEPLERLGADLRRAAYARIERARRRRRRIQVGVAVALAATLMTGIGLAASGVNVLGWVRNDPGNARFQVNRNMVYRGPAPRHLSCQSVAGATFTCSVGAGAAPRVYTFLDRVEQPARTIFGRGRLLRSIASVERRHLLPHGRAERLRRDVKAVGDDFFRAMQRLPLVESVGVGVGSSSKGAIVPPPGIPMLIFCDSVGASVATCHPLAGAVGVPARAPFYELEPSADWVRLKRSGSQQPNDFAWQIELALGRTLDPAEIRLLTELAVPLSSAPVHVRGTKVVRGHATASGGGAAEPDSSSSSSSSSGGFSSSDR